MPTGSTHNQSLSRKGAGTSTEAGKLEDSVNRSIRAAPKALRVRVRPACAQPPKAGSDCELEASSKRDFDLRHTLHRFGKLL